jgi:type I restriction enzyme S subunit
VPADDSERPYVARRGRSDVDALLAIDPEYAQKILAGEKDYEFRRQTFADPDAVGTIYLYATAPIQRIVGGFVAGEVVEAKPETLWDRFGDSSGIDNRETLLDYFEGTDTGYAIRVGERIVFAEGVDPDSVFENFSPPMSFQYLDAEEVERLRRAATVTTDPDRADQSSE